MSSKPTALPSRFRAWKPFDNALAWRTVVRHTNGRSMAMRRTSVSGVEPVRVGASARGWSGGDWLFLLLVCAAIVVAYLPVWHAGFVWDDDSHVTKNPCLIGPLGFKDIWTSPAGFYFPLVTSTFWVLHALFGLNPLPYHLINVAFHAGSAVLLWRVLLRLRIPGAGLGALLWALHPVQVESVAWIAELKNTQSTLFYLLAIGCFLRWVEGGSPVYGSAASDSSAVRAEDMPPVYRPTRWYALALLAAVAAILSKSATVMLPVVLGLCWWWMAKRWRWRWTLWLVPFAAVSAVASLWTIWEQQFHSGAIGADWSQSKLERVIIAGRDIWFYLGKLAWPEPLIFVYPRWTTEATRFASYLPAIAAVMGLAALWWWRNRRRPLFFAAAYFTVSLFPVLGFFNVYFFRYSYVGDHFQYLASMGVLALAGAGIATALARLGKARAALRWVLPGLLLLTLGTLTWRQSGTYHDIATLYRTTIARNPRCSMALYNLGKVLREAGRTDEAMGLFERAVQVDPEIPDARTALGIALADAGRNDEALVQLQAAVRLDPKLVTARNDLGIALGKVGRLPEAVAQFQAALQIDPTSADAENNLGNALRASGYVADAITHYRRALKLDPNLVNAHNNLGATLRVAQNFPGAIAEFEESLRLNAAQPDVHDELGVVLLLARRPQEAIVHFESALRLNPNLAQAERDLAIALERVGRTDEAAAHYEAARRLGVSR